MARQVRVLPALIAVSIGALAFKAVDISQALAEGPAKDKPPEGEGGAKGAAGKDAAKLTPTPKGGEEGAAAEKPAEKCAPAIDYASETGLSQEEIKVLRTLADRRAQLDQREKQIDTREQTAAAAEARLDDQIGQLKSLEKKVQGILDAMDAKRDERMDGLVKTYEAMKPAAAARIFDQMDDETLVDLAKRMKSPTLAAVLAQMKTDRAEKVTRLLSNLSKPPVAADALKAISG